MRTRELALHPDTPVPRREDPEFADALLESVRGRLATARDRRAGATPRATGSARGSGTTGTPVCPLRPRPDGGRRPRPRRVRVPGHERAPGGREPALVLHASASRPARSGAATAEPARAGVRRPLGAVPRACAEGNDEPRPRDQPGYRGAPGQGARVAARREGRVASRRGRRRRPAYEEDIGPLNGARVVARAWVDPEYQGAAARRRDCGDRRARLRRLQGEHMVARREHADVHNVVVCTLCSCYPWPVLGLPPAWYKAPAYRSRVVREPRAVLPRWGSSSPTTVEVRVWDSSAEVRYLVLPERPAGTDEPGGGRARRARHPRLDDRRRAAGARRPERGERRPTWTAPAAPPRRNGELVFEVPWESRAFGVALALCEAGALRVGGVPPAADRGDRPRGSATTAGDHVERRLALLRALARLPRAAARREGHGLAERVVARDGRARARGRPRSSPPPPPRRGA